MFKDIQITLYDLFGYLLPGSITLLAWWIAFRTLFWPADPVIVWAQLSVQAVAFLFFVAYLAGHLGQAAANLLQRLRLVDPRREFSLPAEITCSLNRAVASRFSVKVEELTAAEVHQLCDETLLHHGSLGEREIFTYREGFYRGSFVALALFACAVALRAAYGPAKIGIAPGAMVDLARGPLIFLTLTAALAAWLALRRYKRFARQGMYRCALRFLALATAASSQNGTDPESTLPPEE